MGTRSRSAKRSSSPSEARLLRELQVLPEVGVAPVAQTRARDHRSRREVTAVAVLRLVLVLVLDLVVAVVAAAVVAAVVVAAVARRTRARVVARLVLVLALDLGAAGDLGGHDLPAVPLDRQHAVVEGLDGARSEERRV